MWLAPGEKVKEFDNNPFQDVLSTRKLRYNWLNHFDYIEHKKYVTKLAPLL